MAVQGAAARIIVPAMYWLASAGEIHWEKTWRKKSPAKSNPQTQIALEKDSIVWQFEENRVPTSYQIPSSLAANPINFLFDGQFDRGWEAVW
jgi:hypothetical protein